MKGDIAEIFYKFFRVNFSGQRFTSDLINHNQYLHPKI